MGNGPGLYADQYIGEVLLGIDPVPQAAGHQGLQDGEAFSAFVMPDEERVLWPLLPNVPIRGKLIVGSVLAS